jgi:FKBP-type peptidyl-prolyl cis-trans isomerase
MKDAKTTKEGSPTTWSPTPKISKKSMEERVDFLTPDRRLSKVVHSPGSGRVVQIDDVVTLHYDAYYMVSGGKRVRFDSTAERGSEFSFRVLKEATLLGLENAVLTMRLGERATVRMSPEFGFGALGGRFHEFGKTVPPGAHIEFELTVLHISSPTDLEEMDKEREKPLSERMAVADQMRSEGNALFKANDYSGAVQKYKQAISFLRLVHPTVEQTKQRAALLVPLCLNVAQCLLLQNLVKVIQSRKKKRGGKSVLF